MRGETTFITAQSLARLPQTAVERVIRQIHPAEAGAPASAHSREYRRAVPVLLNNRRALAGEVSEADRFKVRRDALRLALERAGPLEAPVRVLGARRAAR